MNLFFAAQRAPSGARIFSVQAGTAAAPPQALTADPLLTSATSMSTSIVREVLVLIDQPAPRVRCIFMDHQNRSIRL